MTALFLALALAAVWAQAPVPEQGGQKLHPEARARVAELAGSEDPRVQYWGWRHLEFLGDGVLPALQPLLSHEDPVRQWKALKLLRPYQQHAPDRIPDTLRLPEHLVFAPDRVAEAIFMVAAESGHSVVVHDGALEGVVEPLRLQVEPWSPWDDLTAWCESAAGVTSRSLHGVLVLGGRFADESEERSALRRLQVPEGLAPTLVYSRTMQGVSPGQGMRVIQQVSPGAGLIVLPGVWAHGERFSYQLCGAPWYGVVEAMTSGTGARAFFCGTTLVVAGARDRLPEGLEQIDFSEFVRPAADDESPPQLTHYDVLTGDPLRVLSEIAGRAGVFSAIVPAIRAHVASLPSAVRPGYARDEPRPWLHARFDSMPADEAMHLVARLLGLDAKVTARQLQLSILPPAGEEK